jgi:hypothetical protein
VPEIAALKSAAPPKINGLTPDHFSTQARFGVLFLAFAFAVVFGVAFGWRRASQPCDQELQTSPASAAEVALYKRSAG